MKGTAAARSAALAALLAASPAPARTQSGADAPDATAVAEDAAAAARDVPAPANGTSAPARSAQRWDAITMFHGMPSRNVNAIAQDRDGVIWFATDAGLVRYDGQRVERVPLERSASAVLALAGDALGRLWIGTESGAFVRDGAATRAVPHTAGHRIAAILVPPRGPARLASERGRLFTCSLDEPLRDESTGPEQAPLLRGADGRELALSSLALHDGELLVGTRGRGLLALAGGSFREVRDAQRPFFVNAVAAAGAALVFGADTNPAGRGLFVLEAERMRALDVLTGPVTAVAIDGVGDVWAGTRDRGLVHVRGGRVADHFTTVSTGGGLQSDRILAVSVDRDGVVWAGTDRGVVRYDPKGPRAQRLSESADGNFVHALFVSADGRLWAGTQRGLFVRAAGGGPWQLQPALAHRAVHAIGTDSGGRLLAGCASSLERYDGASWRTVRADASSAPASVRAIATYRGAVHLAAFGRGLERLDGEARTLLWPAADDDPARREIVSLAGAADGLWIGTARAGTFVLAGASVSRSEALSALGTLRCAAEDGRGGTWVGTERGLFRLARGRALPVVEGEDVRAVVPDGTEPPSAWCATLHSGLMHAALDPELGPLASRLGTEYGLPSQSVFAMIAAGEPRRLVLGTNRGVADYDPRGSAPGLRLVRVLGRRPYTPDEWPALRLDYPQNGLLVQAAALGSRTYPEHFQYAFTLSQPGGRTVARALSRDGQFSATSLAPGRYRVAARAFGTNLVPSAPVALEFEVGRAPLPWPSIALGALLACALLALGWGARQNSRLRRANAALSATRLQLVQETENERRRIARDLHDQTLADLRGLLMTLPPGAGAVLAGGLRESVEGISTEVRRICEDLSPSVLENVGLTAALEWALDEALGRCPPEAACRGSFSCPEGIAERLALEPAVEIQVYRIVQEALTNAARHARPRELRVSLRLDARGALEIAVEDDGAGFDWKAARAGRGITNIRSRASLIGAHVEWRPREGGGTRFVLRKPGADAQ